jgi:hypothetical protein
MMYLNDCTICHCQCADKEAEGDTGNGKHFDSNLAETGVDESVHNGNQDDQGKRVDIREEIIGKPIRSHVRGH